MIIPTVNTVTMVTKITTLTIKNTFEIMVNPFKVTILCTEHQEQKNKWKTKQKQ